MGHGCMSGTAGGYFEALQLRYACPIKVGDWGYRTGYLVSKCGV